MARIFVLDSGPLATACDDDSKNEVAEFNAWRFHAAANGAHIVIPEIADYEVRRELFRAKKFKSLQRLDNLDKSINHVYLPLSTSSIRRAAELWANARETGVPTAEDKALDADVILAAQALEYSGEADQLIVVSANYRHIGRYVDSQFWPDITI